MQRGFAARFLNPKAEILFLLVLAVIVPVTSGKAQRVGTIYYFAAMPVFQGLPEELEVRGISNLPVGSKLTVNLYDPRDFANPLSEEAVVLLGSEGSFRVTVHAKRGQEFHHGMVCIVVFMPTYPIQDRAVLRVVGKSGEHLGFPQNPLAYQASASYYLEQKLWVQ